MFPLNSSGAHPADAGSCGGQLHRGRVALLEVPGKAVQIYKPAAPGIYEPNLTGFAQAEEILRQLEESGADDLTVLLEGWSQPMLQGKIDVKASPASALGGKKELAALLG